MGIGWGMKIRGDRHAVLCFAGDGATSEGDFHESLNFAGVYHLPVVFLIQNNHWAISIPREKQTLSETLAQKALAYGFDGIQVDGNDALAVYAATKEAVDRAKKGGGPTLIEAVTYRIGPHTTSDDPTRYRDKEEVERWKGRDPIARVEALLPCSLAAGCRLVACVREPSDDPLRAERYLRTMIAAEAKRTATGAILRALEDAGQIELRISFAFKNAYHVVHDEPGARDHIATMIAAIDGPPRFRERVRAEVMRTLGLR